jgi:hypothetical protein
MTTTTDCCPTIDLPPLDYLAGQLGDDERPSLVTDHVWLYADGPAGDETDDENPDAGKWLLYSPRAEVDGVWAAVKLLTEQGWLGTGAKVSTRYGNPNANGPEHVVNIYVPDWRDTAEVRRVLVNLRAAGFGSQVSFKRTRETTAGKYVNRGDRGVCVFTAPKESERFYTGWLGGRTYLDGPNDAAVVAAIEAGDE